MIKLNLARFAEIIRAEYENTIKGFVSEVSVDSRKFVERPDETVFFALKGQNHNGHAFLQEMYDKGLRLFVCSEQQKTGILPEDARIFYVKNSLDALQALAAYTRQQFKGTVIALTGSNGKTVVKEWLNDILRKDYSVFRSPKSYNSQLGVSLSLLMLHKRYDFALIEAGISQPGEMHKLEAMVKPDYGIFTGLGEAHQQNFTSYEEKLKEKWILFKNTRKIFLYSGNLRKKFPDFYNQKKEKVYSCGESIEDKTQIIKTEKTEEAFRIKYRSENASGRIQIPFKDLASLHNTYTCLAVSSFFIKDIARKADRFEKLKAVEMRLEVKKGINNCLLINDAYSSDLNSLDIALDALYRRSVKSGKKTLILSDILQSGFREEILYRKLAGKINKSEITRFIGIGKAISTYKSFFSPALRSEFYTTSEDFIKNMNASSFRNELILLKGARAFKFERISDILQLKKHHTRLEVNMAALLHNVNYYRAQLTEKTKLAAMVKAFSYGSGLSELALFLEHQQVEYFGVAYADEGVKLRKAGLKAPIMVMNPDTEYLNELFEYKLEPEIYSFEILKAVTDAAQKNAVSEFKAHLKIDTGMARLGFSPEEIPNLCKLLKQKKELNPVSFFSHLASTDEPESDDFTHRQLAVFQKAYEEFCRLSGYKPMRHVLNSSGIERFPEYRFEMVRAGIGLYGFSPNNREKLRNIASLKSVVSQIRHLKKGESVGYGRAGKMPEDGKIAVVPVGYADGYSRALSNGKASVFINSKPAPIIGRVCMDMLMANITGIDVSVGDEVVLFGDNFTAQKLAETLDTIPYEILTGISQRVKRVYYY